MVEKEGIDTVTVGIISVLSTILLVVIMVGLQAVFYRLEAAEYQRKVVDRTGQGVALRQIAEQGAVLRHYAWADKESRRVKVPIEQAMQMVVRDFANR